MSVLVPMLIIELPFYYTVRSIMSEKALLLVQILKHYKVLISADPTTLATLILSLMIKAF